MRRRLHRGAPDAEARARGCRRTPHSRDRGPPPRGTPRSPPPSVRRRQAPFRGSSSRTPRPARCRPPRASAVPLHRVGRDRARFHPAARAPARRAAPSQSAFDRRRQRRQRCAALSARRRFPARRPHTTAVFRGLWRRPLPHPAIAAAPYRRVRCSSAARSCRPSCFAASGSAPASPRDVLRAAQSTPDASRC